VEFGYSEGLTRSGLIGIKLWLFYNRTFKKLLKKKILQYLFYSKYKSYLFLINNIKHKLKQKQILKFKIEKNTLSYNVKTKSTKISKK
jgi:ribosomal protein S3